MSRLPWKRILLAVFVLLASALLVYRQEVLPRQAAPQPALTDLHAVADLRAQFNQDEGRPRLILLLSPT